MDFQTNIYVLHLTKRWLAWIKKKNFLYFSSALQDSISKTCTYKTNSAALYIILSIKVILYSFILNTENALILPSRVIFLMLSFTAGQHSPTCVGAINFKTQESSKEEDQRIHSFVLEILWGCHKIRTCTLFSLWHFFVHLEELYACTSQDLPTFLFSATSSQKILSLFSDIAFNTGLIYFNYK